MNGYKKIFKSKKLRIAILQTLNFLPDKSMLKIQYFIKLKRRLNLKSPVRYSEKVQWYKLYYRDNLMKICCDKADVRSYVKECGMENILNECYGVYSSAKEIDFDCLPESFVIKDTMGGGGDSVILVDNKNDVDIQKLHNVITSWVQSPVEKKNVGREWVYDGKKHRIIIEKLLKADDSGDLPDYKFFCFNGEVFCSYMMKNYTKNHSKGIMGFFDRDFNLLPVWRADFAPMKEQPVKPKNYDEMVKMAEILSKPFPHVRVDFYNIDGKIIFGELTFFTASGYTQFEPDEFDVAMGKQFVLPPKSVKD